MDHPLRIARREHIYVRPGDDNPAQQNAERGPEAKVWLPYGVVLNVRLRCLDRNERCIGREE